MGCCGNVYSGTKSGTQNVYTSMNMKDLLLSNGFVYGGKCGCDIPKDDYFKNGYRVRASQTHFWLYKQAAPGVFNQVTWGRSDELQAELTKQGLL